MRRSLAPILEVLGCLLLLFSMLAAPAEAACGCVEGEAERTELVESVTKAEFAEQRESRLPKLGPSAKQASPERSKPPLRLRALPRPGWHLPLRL